MHENVLWTVSDVAGYLKVSKKQVYLLMHEHLRVAASRGRVNARALPFAQCTLRKRLTTIPRRGAIIPATEDTECTESGVS